MRLQYHQLTSVGDRENNQDYMAREVNDRYALFVVADGLGGHHAGEKASKYFCRGLLGLSSAYSPDMDKNPEQTMASWIDGAIDQMSGFFSGDRHAADAYTTCAILYLQDNFLVVAHCGDSRVYRLTEEELLWRTKDHSVTQNLLEEGGVTEQQMGIHPDQNKLIRSINVQKIHQPEIKVHSPAEKGETFILCSDGFWEFTKISELQHLAKSGIEKKDLMKQARLAMLRAGGRSDNITVQWVRISEV